MLAFLRVPAALAAGALAGGEVSVRGMPPAPRPRVGVLRPLRLGVAARPLSAICTACRASRRVGGGAWPASAVVGRAAAAAAAAASAEAAAAAPLGAFAASARPRSPPPSPPSASSRCQRGTGIWGRVFRVRDCTTTLSVCCTGVPFLRWLAPRPTRCLRSCHCRCQTTPRPPPPPWHEAQP